MKKSLFIVFFSFLFYTGCASLLGKNQGREGASSQNTHAHNSLLATLFGDENEGQERHLNSSANLNLKSEQNRLPSSMQQAPRYNRPDIMTALSPLHLTRVEGNTWRTAANPAVVYGIMARILSQSYIISSTDRRNFNVQTDWDKFFIDGRLFRNRMSVTVFPIGNRQTEVVIKNAVEYYTGVAGKQEENTAWLPSPDLTDEVTKLVENTDKQTTYAYSQTFMRN